MTATRCRHALILLTVLLSGCALERSEVPQGATPTRVPLTPTATPLLLPQPTATMPAEAVLATPIPVSLPTTSPVPVNGWRPPPYPAPFAIRPQDHFYFERPIPSGEVNWPNPNYRYGSTLFGEMSVHTGIDLAAQRGAVVVAAGDGEVVWEGYGLYRGIEDPTDPYGMAVAIRHDFGYNGLPLYTVYAHLEEETVWVGQQVHAGDPIGAVGDTGHAEGPHLHFEVRLGDNRYFNTFNPELWIAPPEGWGVLAGRVMNSSGIPLTEYLVQIRSLETDQRWNVWTYANDTTIQVDANYQENFVISDLPAGPYEVRIDFVGRQFLSNFFLYPGQTNIIHFQGRYGFSVHPTATPSDPHTPPG